MLGLVSALRAPASLPDPRAAAAGSARASLSAPLAQTRSRVIEPFATAVGARQSGDIGALTGSAGNAGTAASLLQTADTGLSEISAALTKMKDLATQAATTTPTAKQPVVRSDAERAILNAEFDALRTEVDRIAGDTEFGGIKVLNGVQITFKVGTGIADQDDIAISLQAATAAALASGLASDAITGVSGASQALTNVTSAIDALKDIRAKVDGASVRFQSAQRNLSSGGNTLRNLRDGLVDRPVAVETARNLARLIDEEHLAQTAPALSAALSGAVRNVLQSASPEPLAPRPAGDEASSQPTPGTAADGASAAKGTAPYQSREEPAKTIDIEA